MHERLTRAQALHMSLDKKIASVVDQTRALTLIECLRGLASHAGPDGEITALLVAALLTARARGLDDAAFAAQIAQAERLVSAAPAPERSRIVRIH